MNSPTNVARHLETMAAIAPHRLAVVVPHGRDRAKRVSYTHLTFRQLDEESNRLANAFGAIGIRRGTRAALMVPPSLDFFTAAFALFKVGAVPVLIDPGMGIRRLGRCLAEAEPEAFIGVPKAHLARIVLRWARGSIRTTVSAGTDRWLAQHNLDVLREAHLSENQYTRPDTGVDETAAFLFTSGSTGPAKGVVYTHGIFEAQVEMLKGLYAIEPGEVDLATFPLFALFAPALGMTAIVPDMDATRPARVDPRKILEAVENFGVTNLFGSPALLNRLARYPHLTPESLGSLKRVISAGAPVPIKTIERLRAKLPAEADVHTPYGATEALPVASADGAMLAGQAKPYTERGSGTCVGVPVAGMEVRVIAIGEEPIGQWNESLALQIGQIGEIVAHGPVVTQSYHARPEATEMAKIPDPLSGRMRHRMGDLGYFDSRGRLWFCGRKSQRVETPRGVLFTVPTEAVFNAHPLVFRSALVGVRRQGLTYPVLCVELEKGMGTYGPDIEAELKHLAGRHRHTEAIQAVLIHPDFPVDIRHNAKIFREKLAVWASKALARSGWQPALGFGPIALPPTFDELKSEEPQP